MVRLTITTTIPAKGKPGNLWFNFEADEASIDDVYKTLAEKGIVRGCRVTTNVDQNGNRIATQRRTYLLGLYAVAVIEPLTVEYFEMEADTVLTTSFGPAAVIPAAAQ